MLTWFPIPKFYVRFYREAQSAGTLQHSPNIVTVFDLGEIPGSTLHRHGVRGRRKPAKHYCAAADHPPGSQAEIGEAKICSGLDHAHKSGIVHRDVKPGNTLVKHDGTVKVVDFGIVRIESTTLTKTGTFMGTIQYASPEQLSEGHVDQRSDLWSVVCVLYEFIAYRKPLEGSNFGAIVGKILTYGTGTLKPHLPRSARRVGQSHR